MLYTIIIYHFFILSIISTLFYIKKENNINGGEKMKNYFLKVIVVCLTVIMLFPATSVSAKECYWYCKRNSEHKQPLCDSNLSFIENFGGIYLDKRYGDNSSEKVIYLTFDVGYENGNVEKVLNAMAEEGVKGSFFILGNVIDRAPDLVKRIAAEGHSVCNHTVNHKNLTDASIDTFNSELTELEKKYRELTGREMSKFFRPPEGTFNEEMLKRAQALGYRTVFWSFAYADWDNKIQMNEKAALDKIFTNLHNGEIMLLHPTGETNAKIMKRLITELKAQGYRFATLDEL